MFWLWALRAPGGRAITSPNYHQHIARIIRKRNLASKPLSHLIRFICHSFIFRFIYSFIHSMEDRLHHVVRRKGDGGDNLVMLWPCRRGLSTPRAETYLMPKMLSVTWPYDYSLDYKNTFPKCLANVIRRIDSFMELLMYQFMDLFMWH